MPSASISCFLICSILLPIIACSDEKDESGPPLGDPTGWVYFETFDAEIVCDNSALVWGLIDGPADELISHYGHCWDTLPDPDTIDPHTSYGRVYGGDYFSSYLTNLKPGTTYYFRTYLVYRGALMYGGAREFNTLSPDDTLRPPECGPIDAH